MGLSQQLDTCRHALHTGVQLPWGPLLLSMSRGHMQSGDRMQRFDFIDRSWQVGFCIDEASGNGGEGTNLEDGRLSISLDKAVL